MKLVKVQAGMLKKLKTQVRALERKEKATHRKLQLALASVKKIAQTYEKKLVKKTRDAKMKTVLMEAAIYTRLAESIRKHALDVKKVQRVVAQRAAMKKRSQGQSKKK